MGVVLKLLSNLLKLPAYWFGVLVPRDRNLWVFGSWFGQRYADNTRYVFEHIRQHRRDLRPVWLTRRADVVKMVRASGGEAHLIRSLRGFWLGCRAGMTLVTCGLEDVNALAVSRSKRIQLWHGTPLKHILADDIVTRRGNASGFGRILRALWSTLFAFKRDRWDVVVSPSPAISSRLASAFQVPVQRVKVTGYPRGDVLLRNPPDDVPILSVLRRNLGVTRFVCYAPTHRQEGRSKANLFAGLPVDRLQGTLAEHAACFLVRAHYYQELAISELLSRVEASHVHLITEAQVQDLNYVLPFLSVLITDYSSVMFDFLLLDRPMVFAPFDLQDYVQIDREFYEDYDAVTPGPKCQNWSEVIAELDRILDGHDQYATARRTLCRRYNQFLDTGNCARVIDVAERQWGEHA